MTGRLNEGVTVAVRGEDDVRAIREEDARGVAAEGLDVGKLREEPVRVDDGARPADGGAPGGEDAARHLMQTEDVAFQAGAGFIGVTSAGSTSGTTVCPAFGPPLKRKTRRA